ncbi:hypothetical protein PVK06_007558 [Gossypium arboreum]|uniref:Uncharacterized protein n=1 Tax=Gossypium arboreum TaxID=29729 RepID=A0ABR0QII1_GOSAR|nr:hypothetical protein PVK06_007558 [Gossypium arboreum]
MISYKNVENECSCEANTCAGGAGSNPNHTAVVQVPNMDVKAILSSSHVTKKYQNRPRAIENASVTKESEPPQLKWCRLKKGLLSPKVSFPLVPSLPIAIAIQVEPSQATVFPVQDVDTSQADLLAESLPLDPFVIPSTSHPKPSTSTESFEFFP